jgi:hypothetical protein
MLKFALADSETLFIFAYSLPMLPMGTSTVSWRPLPRYRSKSMTSHSYFHQRELSQKPSFYARLLRHNLSFIHAVGLSFLTVGLTVHTPSH